MINNLSFELNEKQLSDLNNWVSSFTQSLYREGVSESIEINVQFNFSIYGRTVEASIASSDAKMTIEDSIDQFLTNQPSSRSELDYLGKKMMTPEFLLFNGEDWTLTAKIDGKSLLRDVSAGTNDVIALIRELSQSTQSIINFDEHPKKVTKLEIDFKSRKVFVIAETLTTDIPHSDKKSPT